MLTGDRQSCLNREVSAKMRLGFCLVSVVVCFCSSTVGFHSEIR